MLENITNKERCQVIVKIKILNINMDSNVSEEVWLYWHWVDAFPLYRSEACGDASTKPILCRYKLLMRQVIVSAASSYFISDLITHFTFLWFCLSESHPRFLFFFLCILLYRFILLYLFLGLSFSLFHFISIASFFSIFLFLLLNFSTFCATYFHSHFFSFLPIFPLTKKSIPQMDRNRRISIEDVKMN